MTKVLLFLLSLIVSCSEVPNNKEQSAILAQNSSDAADSSVEKHEPNTTGKGIFEPLNDCLKIENTNEANTDGTANACEDQDDKDTDVDGIADFRDNCPVIENTNQADTDGDRIGDVCDDQDNRDVDEDGIENFRDNCPVIENTNQADTDGDGIGDSCDNQDNRDTDKDSVENYRDNCPNTMNKDQTDLDLDGKGDACDEPSTNASNGSYIIVDLINKVSDSKLIEGFQGRARSSFARPLSSLLIGSVVTSSGFQMNEENLRLVHHHKFNISNQFECIQDTGEGCRVRIENIRSYVKNQGQDTIYTNSNSSTIVRTNIPANREVRVCYMEDVPASEAKNEICVGRVIKSGSMLNSDNAAEAARQCNLSNRFGEGTCCSIDRGGVGRWYLVAGSVGSKDEKGWPIDGAATSAGNCIN